MKQQNDMKRSIQDDAIQSSKKRKNNNAIGNASTNAAKNNNNKKNDNVNVNDDKETMEMGTENTMDLPHMRKDCTKHTFIPDVKYNTASSKVDTNYQSCDKCFCYVCDIPVQDCKDWSIHCNANDKGRFAYRWNEMSRKIKRANSTNNNNSDDDGTERIIQNSFQYCYRISYDRQYEIPLEPYKVAPGSHVASIRLQCRKCKWWSVVRKEESHYNPYLLENELESWCKACGRVISTRYFHKNQEEQRYPIHRGDIYLGTKVIPFHIKARDPRKIEPYKQKWQEWEGKEGWIYNESEMKYDFFHHRIGPRPAVSTLLEVMSIVEESKIPHDGSRMVFSQQTASDLEKIYAFETEALIIDDRNDRIIIEELKNVSSFNHFIDANYNEHTQDGVCIALNIIKMPLFFYNIFSVN